jgi:hypothetical protein
MFSGLMAEAPVSGCGDDVFVRINPFLVAGHVAFGTAQARVERIPAVQRPKIIEITRTPGRDVLDFPSVLGGLVPVVFAPYPRSTFVLAPYGGILLGDNSPAVPYVVDHFLTVGHRSFPLLERCELEQTRLIAPSDVFERGCAG